MSLPQKLNERLLLLLLLFGMGLIAMNWWRNQSRIQLRALEVLEGQLIDMGVRLSGMLQHFVRRGLVPPGELEMSYAATVPELELGIVCSASDEVRFATHLQWIRVALHETPLQDAVSLANEVRASMTPRVVCDSKHSVLTGAFPFYEQFHSRDRGVVLLRFNTTAVLSQSARDAMLESAAQACALLALCLLLWVALDVMVTRRVQELAAYAQSVGGGGAERDHGDATDELSVVARSFEEAVKNLRMSELRLVEAAEGERRRIGADLHDDVCQRLSAAQLKAGVLESALRRNQHAQASLAGSVADELAKATRVARGFAHGLAPMLVQKGRLPEALHQLAATISDSFALRCECACELGGNVLGVWVDTHVYRVVQELATNAAKHAHPSFIDIIVKIIDAALTIRVTSDGQAWVRSQGGGIGLELVAQRVRALGGHWGIVPREGNAGGSVAVCAMTLEPRHFSDDGASA